MPDLPHGWRMRNSSVDIRGPPVEEDGFAVHSGDEDSENGEPLDIEPDSEGWEDVEDDTERLSVKCLLCDESFPAVKTMLSHSVQSHQFDLQKIRQNQSKCCDTCSLPPKAQVLILHVKVWTSTVP